jgi:hypothetical protein
MLFRHLALRDFWLDCFGVTQIVSVSRLCSELSTYLSTMAGTEDVELAQQVRVGGWSDGVRGVGGVGLYVIKEQDSFPSRISSNVSLILTSFFPFPALFPPCQPPPPTISFPHPPTDHRNPPKIHRRLRGSPQGGPLHRGPLHDAH